MVAHEVSSPSAAEERLRDLCITLPAPPEPFGTYVEAVRTGNLLSLTGMLPTQSREAKFTGRVGAELGVEAGREAAHLAKLNALAIARQHLGSLDRVTRIVRLGASVPTSGEVAISRRLPTQRRSCFRVSSEKTKNPCRLVNGAAGLPLDCTVELESHFPSGRLDVLGQQR